MKIDFSKFEDVRKFKVKIEGMTPYLQNKLDIDAVHNPIKATKNQRHDKKAEAEKALYKNKKGVFVPERHIKSALVKSSTDFRWKGQKTYRELVQASIFVEPEEIPLNAKWVIDSRPEWVRTGSAKVPKPTHRPKFNKWGVGFILTVLDGRIPDETIPEIIAGAGLRYGSGECHSRGFGKFRVVSFTKI